MKVGVEFDTKPLRDVMLLYAKATKKDEVAVINRTARNFAIKVMMFTPVADRQEIATDLYLLPREVFMKLVFARIKKKDSKGRQLLKLSTSGNRDERGKFLKGTVTSREAMKLTIAKFYRHRMNTSGYIKRGWNRVAKSFGAAYESIKNTPYPGSKKSFGKKATESVLAAVFENSAKGAEVSEPAAQKALEATISDMKDYALRVMQGTAKKYSAK